MISFALGSIVTVMLLPPPSRFTGLSLMVIIQPTRAWITIVGTTHRSNTALIPTQTPSPIGFRNLTLPPRPRVSLYEVANIQVSRKRLRMTLASSKVTLRSTKPRICATPHARLLVRALFCTQRINFVICPLRRFTISVRISMKAPANLTR